MILPDREQRILSDIRNRLRRESPDLVARFTLFERLVREDGPPPRELPRPRRP